jgi:hypothetical protein
MLISQSNILNPCDALVMQGLVDVGRMGCEEQPIQLTSTNQKILFAPVNL